MRLSLALRWLGALIVIGGVGEFGLSAVFSDLDPGETELHRNISAGIAYVLGGMLVGALLKSRWYLAILQAWGPALIGVAGIFAALRSGLNQERSWYLLLCLCVMPIAALAGGFIGWRLAQRFENRDDKAK